MKKIFISLMLVLLLLLIASCVHSDPKIEFNVYKCRVCDKEFRSFKGEDLDDRKYHDGKEQLKYIYQFQKYDKNFPECKSGLKYHRFEKRTTASMQVSNLARSNIAEYLAVIKDGKTLSSLKLVECECLYCKKHFFFFNGDNPNIRDWEQQTNYIFSLKGRAIEKCSAPRTMGHVFEKKRVSEAKSYELSKMSANIYWVKN